MRQLKLSEWETLAREAWEVRDKAYILGNTKVGAALLSEGDKIYSGCNIEHMFRSHDIHAETNAISNMISGGERRVIAIIVAAERKQFTPCGSCLDWIFQFGGPECLVGFQSTKGGAIKTFTAQELMPYYPR